MGQHHKKCALCGVALVFTFASTNAFCHKCIEKTENQPHVPEENFVYLNSFSSLQVGYISGSTGTATVIPVIFKGEI